MTKIKTTFEKDVETTVRNIKDLKGRDRLEYIWDYYRYYIIAGAFILFILISLVKMFYEGQRDCRLRICVVLNTENDDCSPWFDEFEKLLWEDGNKTPIDVNQDQPFDYDNMYYYVQEAEVMTTISSGRMDVAICGEDMYSYLLALNACLDLTDYVDESYADRLVQSTANLQVDENGEVDLSEGIDGLFAVDLKGTAFEKEYNKTETDDPLFVVIIRNTENVPDSLLLLKKLSGT